MRAIFYLSGENECLARLEVLNLLKGKEVERDVQILVADIKNNYFDRLALTHEVSKFYISCNIYELDDIFKEIPAENGICVRVIKIRRPEIKSLELERRLGYILWKRGFKINLTNPKIVIRVYISRKCYVGYLVHKTYKKQFLERHPKKRPFSIPCVIPPKIGRAMVNITSGKSILDPMCGTGTFLIEAGLMNLEFVGVEAYERIVKGCAKNLKFFNLPVNVIRGDARNLPFKDCCFEGVVTDFPYKRSTKHFGESLIERAIEEIYRVLKDGCRAVLVINSDIDDIIGEFFEIEGKCYQRVHKSLERRFYICRKTF